MLGVKSTTPLWEEIPVPCTYQSSRRQLHSQFNQVCGSSSTPSSELSIKSISWQICITRSENWGAKDGDDAADEDCGVVSLPLPGGGGGGGGAAYGWGNRSQLLRWVLSIHPLLSSPLFLSACWLARLMLGLMVLLSLSGLAGWASPSRGLVWYCKRLKSYAQIA